MKRDLLLTFGALLIFVAFGFWHGSLKGPALTSGITESPDAVQVTQTIERAYDIEAEAAYTFDLKQFPTVFINDPRFNVSPGTLETVREMTNNPSLDSAGWLDYKMAYYSWRKNAILHAEAVRAKAKAENRELTYDEGKSLVDPFGRMAPARAESAKRKNPLRFISLDIDGRIATVVLDDGPRTVQLTLVLVDNHWYIAGYQGISIHP